MWEEQRPWNIYHYSANNPIVAKDPDGKMPFFVAVVLTFVGEFFSQTQVANSPRNSYEAKHGKEMGERMIQQAADATAVASVPMMIKGAAKHALKESAEVAAEAVTQKATKESQKAARRKAIQEFEKNNKQHKNNARGSTKGTHEKGQAAKRKVYNDKKRTKDGWQQNPNKKK